MLALTRSLIDGLDGGGVRFCQWKSTADLDQALQGVGDLDLLVDPSDWPTFRSVLAGLGFVATRMPSWQSRRDAHHYYGLDESTGRLVHLDVYDRLLTGGTLLKNHHLRLEGMVFGSTRRQGAVPVPSRAAELVLLVIRKTLESASVLEHSLLLREYDNVLQELRWLDDDETRAEARALLERWLPMVDPELFARSLQALGSRGAVVERWSLGQRLSRELRFCEILPAPRAALERSTRMARWLLQRLRLGSTGSALSSGGAIIAFIGPEASGKSTMVADTSAWLRPAFRTHALHAGKPPISPLTAIPNLLVPMLRRAMPKYRTTTFERRAGSATQRGLGFWLYALRCLGLAFDRSRLLRQASRLRANGVVVVCDRYPTSRTGFVDGAMLDAGAQDGPLSRSLARMERLLYERVPRPDLLIVCRVPLAEALRRNAVRHQRGRGEPEDFVRHRHAQFLCTLPAEFQVHLVDTTQPVEQTRRVVRRLIWETLQAGHG
jgi:thymidylate kinase